VTSHSVSLSGLTACTTYHYSVFSEDAVANSSTSTNATFDTTGCTGSASITRKAQTDITRASGGTSSLATGDANLSLTVPASYGGSSDANFQIKQLNTASVTNTTGTTYAGKTRNTVGNHAYNLSAHTSNSALTTSFDQPITVTISYLESEAAYTKESTHRIYRWDGSVWQELSNCTADPGANTVTCTTSSFSTFILMGEPASGGSRQYSGPGALTTTTDTKEEDTTTFEDTTPSEAAVIASLQAQIASLQAQLQLLLQAANTNQRNTPSDIQTVTNTLDIPPAGLYPGDQGLNVRSLQILLNRTQFKVAHQGPGSPGFETDTYGFLTQDAVQRFQLHYGIVQDENSPGYGIFGPRTRAKLVEVVVG
jgi:hypothetical protein